MVQFDSVGMFVKGFLECVEALFVANSWLWCCLPSWIAQTVWLVNVVGWQHSIKTNVDCISVHSVTPGGIKFSDYGDFQEGEVPVSFSMVNWMLGCISLMKPRSTVWAYGPHQSSLKRLCITGDFGKPVAVTFASRPGFWNQHEVRMWCLPGTAGLRTPWIWWGMASQVNQTKLRPDSVQLGVISWVCNSSSGYYRSQATTHWWSS
jgi:hypothetical protein